MGIVFSLEPPPSTEACQRHHDPASSEPLLCTGNSISSDTDTVRRRLTTAAEQHAVHQRRHRNHDSQARRTIAYLQEEQDGHDCSRRLSEPVHFRAKGGEGKKRDVGEEVSGFMRAINGEGGVWRL